MNWFGVLFVTASLAGQAVNLKVDHATLACTDLRKLQAELASAGVPNEYGGKHRNRATEMAIASFQDGSYLELMGKQADADPASFAASHWARFLSDNAGPCGWAVQASDLSAELKRLQSTGVPVGDLEKLGRDRSDGVHLEWEMAQVGTEGHGVFYPFVIRDLTPREKRVNPSGKPTAPQFAGISNVVIAVKDLDDAVRRIRKAYALTAPKRQLDSRMGANLAIFEGTPIVLAAAVEGNKQLSERIARYGPAPYAFVIRRAEHQSGDTDWSRINWLDLKTIAGRLGLSSGLQ